MVSYIQQLSINYNHAIIHDIRMNLINWSYKTTNTNKKKYYKGANTINRH